MQTDRCRKCLCGQASTSPTPPLSWLGLGASLDLWILTPLSTPLTRCHFIFRVLVCEADMLNPQCCVGRGGGRGGEEGEVHANICLLRQTLGLATM